MKIDFETKKNIGDALRYVTTRDEKMVIEVGIITDIALLVSKEVFKEGYIVDNDKLVYYDKEIERYILM